MSMSNTTKRVKEIRRKTRRKFSSKENIRIVLEGLQWVDSSYRQQLGVTGLLICIQKCTTNPPYLHPILPHV